MFQHIITEIHNNEILFFGRQPNGKSIAVRVQGYQPHVILQTTVPREVFSPIIQKAICENYNLCFRVDTVEDYVSIEEVQGRSITNAEVEETFFKVTAKDIGVYKCLKNVLGRQYSYNYKKNHDGTYVCRTKSLPLYAKRYDQVSLVTQYCVANDIATCTTMIYLGIETNTKITTCDTEIIGHVKNVPHVPIPLLALTYDIETLYDVNEKDSYKQPIITIGATLNKEQYVWILNLDEDIVDQLEATDGKFNTNHTTFYNFSDELLLLLLFFPYTAFSSSITSVFL